MLSRWFSAVVVLFWLSTMSWLFVAKVLRPLRDGEPPNYRTVLQELAEHAEGPVAWRISLDGHPIGQLREVWRIYRNGDKTTAI